MDTSASGENRLQKKNASSEKNRLTPEKKFDIVCVGGKKNRFKFRFQSATWGRLINTCTNRRVTTERERTMALVGLEKESRRLSRLGGSTWAITGPESIAPQPATVIGWVSKTGEEPPPFWAAVQLLGARLKHYGPVKRAGVSAALDAISAALADGVIDKAKAAELVYKLC